MFFRLKGENNIFVLPVDQLALVFNGKTLFFQVSWCLEVILFLGLNASFNQINVERVAVVMVAEIVFFAASLALTDTMVNI